MGNGSRRPLSTARSRQLGAGGAITVAIPIAILVATPIPVAAQAGAGRGVIAGVVTDRGGAPIEGVEVTVAGVAPVRTGADGAFVLRAVGGDSAVVHGRRLGFRADSVATRATGREAGRVVLRLAPIAHALDDVSVLAPRAAYSGRLAGYFERLEKRSSGYFITRADIDRANPRMLTNVFQTVPGVVVAQGRSGGAPTVRMRAAQCAPLVWIDGTAMPAGEVSLDSFVPGSIEGIELYLGATDAPARYQWMRGAANCGTILLWSRDADTEGGRDARGLSAADFEQAVSAAGAFASDDVDSAAVPLTDVAASPAYPPSLRAQRIGGLVLAQFIVDTAGRVDDETISFASSSHRLFNVAVRDALREARYRPAVRRGARVAQLAQQSFVFTPPEGRRRR